MPSPEDGPELEPELPELELEPLDSTEAPLGPLEPEPKLLEPPIAMKVRMLGELRTRVEYPAE